MRTVEGYLDLPYHIVLTRDEDDEGNSGYVAEVQELPGCISQGDTPQQAYDSVRDAMVGWITVALEDGRVIPEPVPQTEYSGRILVRTPKSLHAALVDAAEQEGVSLNQFVVGVLSAAVSWRTMPTYQHAEMITSAVISAFEASLERAVRLNTQPEVASFRSEAARAVVLGKSPRLLANDLPLSVPITDS